jgi:hypothetical protein
LGIAALTPTYARWGTLGIATLTPTYALWGTLGIAALTPTYALERKFHRKCQKNAESVSSVMHFPPCGVFEAPDTG